jgi:uncharacterized membrane protein
VNRETTPSPATIITIMAIVVSMSVNPRWLLAARAVLDSVDLINRLSYYSHQ